MNKFFLEKVKKLRESIPLTDYDPLSKMRESMRERTCTFKFNLVSVQLVTNIISNLRCSKATGLDFIDVKNMKAISAEISPCLAHIINLSITTNTFPDVYKHAKVVPLLKSPEKSPLNCSSYRPVALLPVLSRVVEKALFKSATT